MATFVSFLLTVSAALVAVPVVVFFIEVVAAIALARRAERTGFSIILDPNQRVAVLVPAHNESTGLLPTLADIRGQLGVSDRLVVVADNCTDDTATIALAFGAEVIERHDPNRRGKGYALDFGLRHLREDPPEIVIMVDADCRLADNVLGELAVTCASKRRPVQALYLMTAPPASRINQQVAEFAWRVKNWLRPLGLRALGLPCQLVGTGMAFPWAVIRSVDLAGGSIVEDLELGLEHAINGYPPVFCPSARVTSLFASSVAAAATQRQRWEGGHIGMIMNTLPRLFFKALARFDWNLLALTLDLAVPPLSMLTFLVIGMFAIASLSALLGFSSSAMTVSAATVLVFLLTAGLAWLRCGRDLVPFGAILSIPRFILGKLGLYRTIFRNETDPQWIRTDRTKSE